MKVLAALTLLLPAVHVAAISPYFYLRAGEDVNDPVVVKSRDHPGYYVVKDPDEAEPESFVLGTGDTLIDLTGQAIYIGNENKGDLRAVRHDQGSREFYFDNDGELKKRDSNGEEFYLCTWGGRKWEKWEIAVHQLH